MTLPFLNLSLPDKAGDHRYFGQLQGAALALAAAQISTQHQGPVLLVTKDSQMALRLAQEIREFSAQPLELFPDWETCLLYTSPSPRD